MAPNYWRLTSASPLALWSPNLRAVGQGGGTVLGLVRKSIVYRGSGCCCGAMACLQRLTYRPRG
jgi:hypothetical protein